MRRSGRFSSTAFAREAAARRVRKNGLVVVVLSEHVAGFGGGACFHAERHSCDRPPVARLAWDEEHSAPRSNQVSSSTANVLPSGSRNQATLPPPALGEMPFSSAVSPS
jgi:hypothetical protein